MICPSLSHTLCLLLTSVRLKHKVAGCSFHQVRLDSGVINAAGGQDGLDGAPIARFVLYIHGHGERLADVHTLELTEVELYVFFTRRRQRVEPLRHLGAAHRPVQSQSLDLGAWKLDKRH